ncbi:MAG: OB-fold nucleic acid binding domain-containing protein [Tepidisphaeraceae bacterium]
MRIGVIALLTLLAAQTPPTSGPALIKVSDKAAIDAAMDKEVVLDGVVETAAWSASGKVLRIEFKDAGDSKIMAVAFDKNKEDLNEAFSGDVTKALVGAHVRIRGTLKDYKGRPEVVINVPNQVTIVEAGPSTQPSGQ